MRNPNIAYIAKNSQINSSIYLYGINKQTQLLINKHMENQSMYERELLGCFDWSESKEHRGEFLINRQIKIKA